MTPSLLADYAAVMRANGILRVSGEEKEDALDFSIELDPSVFGRADSTAPDVPTDLGAEKKCACGHLQDSEHNSSGLCIAGACPTSICHPETVEKR